MPPIEELLRAGEAIRPFNQLFPQILNASGTPYNPTKIASVTLPDNRQYTFQYNSYGELARLVLPTTGAYEYDWDKGVSDGWPGGELYSAYAGGGGIGFYRRVVERRVYSDGGTGNTYASRQAFGRPETWSPPSNAGYVVVRHYGVVSETDPRSQELHFHNGSAWQSLFAGPQSYPQWTAGKEWKTETLTPAAALLRRLTHTWQQGTAVSAWSLANGYPNNPRIFETLTTLDDNQVSKEFYEYDAYNNITAIRQIRVWQWSAGRAAAQEADNLLDERL